MTPAVVARFWAKVDRSGGPNACWFWTASGRGNGYGCFKFCNKVVDTHRVAYTITKGEIPAGALVQHSCDVRKCCNPAHLSLGTKRTNFDDMVAKGRANLTEGRPPPPHRFGERHGAAKIAETEALDIRQRLAGGASPSDLALEFGLHRTTILRIGSGARWAHLAHKSAVAKAVGK